MYDPFGLKSDPEFDFVDDGACRDVEDPDIFHPTPKDTETLAKAVEICMSCTVLDECFEYALKHPAERGVWGGTTEQERTEMRQATRATS